MNIRSTIPLLLFCLACGATSDAHAQDAKRAHARPAQKSPAVQLGPRPYYLVEDMDEGELKSKLQQCADGPFEPSELSIGHRGAPLLFPEHTKESYSAAARMGAGIIECDVTFTKDRQLVCRHAQCDLHTTTNILAVQELAAKCTQPFTPADPTTGAEASAKCCTSDITLGEFKSLCGKMDAADPTATTVDAYMNATPSYRTDLYSSCGTLLTHAESIQLIRSFNAKFTPELKAPEVPMPFEGDYTQEHYAQALVNDYKAAGIPARHVWPQSFNLGDVLYWVNHEPQFGKQAVYLDDRVDTPEGYTEAVASLAGIAAQGVKIVAPPMPALLELDASQRIVASDYADAANAAGLGIITWTLERSGLLSVGQGGYYYASIAPVIDNDGDMLTVLDALVTKVGVRGVFADWPATVTYYANCMGL